jgi:small subunit ribosomal protein S18
MPKKKPIRKIQKNIAPKKCYFCEEKKEPTFLDTPSLKKFLTERGKITPRSRNGLCARHQRHLTVSIKHARHLALLPFIVR